MQACTVEPLKEDPPIKGHCIKYVSTMDKTRSPNFIPPISIMQLEPLKKDNLYTGDKSLEYVLVPKMSHVIIHFINMVSVLISKELYEVCEVCLKWHLLIGCLSKHLY